MKKTIWADPKREWQGFRFTAYSLNWDKLDTMPLTVESGVIPPEVRGVLVRDPKTGEITVDSSKPSSQDRAVDGQAEESRLTVAGIYRRFANTKCEVEAAPVILSLKVKTENGEVTLKGSSFSCAILREMLALVAEGLNPYSSKWFWYDQDSNRNDPHERYDFFVVCEDKIVRESVSLSDYTESGFDPDVFEAHDPSLSLGFNDEAWHDAITRYWYRKFYTETQTGELMTLRRDDPPLFDYQSHPGSDSAALLQNISALLTKIRTISLLILIGLAVLLVILIWK